MRSSLCRLRAPGPRGLIIGTNTRELPAVSKAAGIIAVLLAGCGGEELCGPSTGVVARVIDGDTIELGSGERIRYLMIDSPEITGGASDCFGPEASQFNSDLVLGQEISLAYDAECLDPFGRYLAYVAVADREVNALMVERGYACVLYIPPNGEDRRAEFEALEMSAKAQARGMWGECQEVTCD